MSPPREILIIGATGRQGNAVLRELSNQLSSSSPPKPSPKPKILALTRNATSAKARALVSSPEYAALDLELVQGDTRDAAAVFASHPGVDAVFACTVPPDELAQAVPLIDTASNPATSNVKRFVFSSVDRGGDERSWENRTDVPHFADKYDIEHYLRSVCEGEGGSGGGGGGSSDSTKSKTTMTMRYTILRPVAFFDNLNPTTSFGPVFAGLWNTMPSDRALQLVSLRDVALFASRALLCTDDAFDGEFAGRAVGLAGDELTLLEARSAFRKVAGAELPQAWWVVGMGVRWAIGIVGKMFAWFEREGYGVDIGKVRQREPRMQSFEAWLRESSRFPCSEEVSEEA